MDQRLTQVSTDMNELKRGYVAHNQAAQLLVAPITGVVSSTMAHGDPLSQLTTMLMMPTKKTSSPNQRFTWGEQMELKNEAEDHHSPWTVLEATKFSSLR